MNTPRIGDTVHYVPQLGDRNCRAAIIMGTGSAGDLVVRVLEPRTADNDYTAVATEDPYRGPNATSIGPHNGFTPGTWHHIH